MMPGKTYPHYSVAIRTLGKAGALYQQTLDSVAAQTWQPDAVIVYIAEGYPLPAETIGRERYVAVKKGMAAQRALPYDEITSEYILFLDDDVMLPPDAVTILFDELAGWGADVVAPATFANHAAPWKKKLLLTLAGNEVCRPWGHRWAFRVLPTAGFSYNNNPKRPVYLSETNAGPCFLCRKQAFLSIHYEEELWLDEMPYSIPDDMVMFYKMHCCGLRMITSFDSGIVHADAHSTLQATQDREAAIIRSLYRNKLIMWYRFIFLRRGVLGRAAAVTALAFAWGLQRLKYTCMGGWRREAFLNGIAEGRRYISASKEHEQNA